MLTLTTTVLLEYRGRGGSVHRSHSARLALQGKVVFVNQFLLVVPFESNFAGFFLVVSI